MSDEVRNVIIDKIEWNNSDLPKWATEATQLKIAQKLGAQVEIIKKTEAGEKKGREKEEKSQDKTRTILEKGFKSLQGAAKNQTQAFNKFSAEKLIPKTPFKAFNNGIKSVAGKLGIFGAALGAVGFVVGTIVGRLKSFSDQFRTLFATGFRFEKGSVGLAQAAVRAEMSLDQYTEILGRYSTTVGVLGTKAFSDLNVAMRENLAEVGLLGMNLGELTEYTADYLDQRRLLGILEESDRNALASQTETYIKNITAMTTLLNVSREQITQIVKSSVTVAAFTNALNKAPGHLREQMLATAQVVTAGFAGLGNDYGNQLANAFTTAIGRGGLYFTEVGRELLAISQPLYHAMSDLTNTVGPQEAGAKFSAMLDIMANVSDGERERLMILERSNTQYANGARAMIGLINQAQQLEKEQIDAIKNMEAMREAQKPDEITRAFTNFEIAMQKARIVFDTFFTTLFGNRTILGTIERVFTRLSEVAVKVANWFLEKAEAFGMALANGLEAIIKWGSKFEGMSIGEGIVHMLKPFLLAMKFAIAGAIKMGFNAVITMLPGFMPGDQTPWDEYQANKEKLKVAKQHQAGIFAGHGGTSIVMNYDKEALRLKKLANAHEKDLNAKFTGWSDKDLKDNEYVSWFHEDEVDKEQRVRKKLKQTLEKITDLEKRRAKYAEDVAKFTKQDIKNKEQFINEYGPEYDYDKTMAANKLIRKEGFVDPITVTPENATETSMRTPHEITAAKMQIMRQYLPMAGKGDPNQDPTGNYYEQMIAELKLLNTKQSNQIRALEGINVNTN